MPYRSVFLFPGLGAYSTGVLRQARTAHQQVHQTFNEIDEVAAGLGIPSISNVLFGPEEMSIRDLLRRRAEILQLAIFGTSVATHRILVDTGKTPWLLVGHSFGEMAALVCARAFSLADGVRMVCARTEVLRPWEGRGAMAALGVSEKIANHLIGLIDEPELAIACLNAPRQTVISGPIPAIAKAEQAAKALDIFAARLQLPYASHHPSMRQAANHFLDLIADLKQQPFELPVISPIHGRRYTDTDDLRLALAECLVRPVAFTGVVRDLHARNASSFVEVGALNALTRCVELTVPGVDTVAPLVNANTEIAGLQHAASGEGSAPVKQKTQWQQGNGSRQQAAEVVAPIAFVATAPAAREPADNGNGLTHSDYPLRTVDSTTTTGPTVFDRLQALYAEALEYPPDVLTSDARLEADLGVDSLKQTALLARVIEQFHLPGDAGELRVWEFPTLGHIADHIQTASVDAEQSVIR